jgi:hypothetical protein
MPRLEARGDEEGKEGVMPDAKKGRGRARAGAGRRGAAGSESSSSDGAPLAAGRELVVVMRPEAGVRAAAGNVASLAGADVAPLADVFAEVGAALHPLFGLSEERLLLRAAATAEETGTPPPDLSVFYKVEAPDARLEEVAERLRAAEVVETAFVKPAAELPQRLNDMLPAPEAAPPATPDFIARQSYLDAAPGGVDARFAWAVSGGGGAGVRIIDIEGAWRFSHEDLAQNQGGVAGGTPSADLAWRNHGTAVVGEFGGDRNGFGVTGICPDANVRAISVFGSPEPGWGSAAAVRRAADMLGPGDIILIELHRPGPRFNFQLRNDQRGYIAVEWWPDDLRAIQYAVSRGVIVVEAAGNGAENLDDALYDANPASPHGPFPAWWRNPFRRNPVDAGAIIVGAGAPPPGTHGRHHGPDRSRLDFSNFGAAVDAQGWGREVTTCGYGDLQGGENEDFWYTDRFSGTSSASPVVVGALGCAQGARRAAGQALLTPHTARALLRTTGSPQQDGPAGPRSQRIGNRPDLRQMISPAQPSATVPLYRYWNPGAGDYLYTTDWNELGPGRSGWGYEGVQCHVLAQPRAGSVPLHRYWHPTVADHFYTTDWRELGPGKFGWEYQGVQCHVYPSRVAGAVPLYRYWNAGAGDHRYTTNWAELGAGRSGWRYEWIQCYVFPQPTPLPPAGHEGAPLTHGGSPPGQSRGDSAPCRDSDLESGGCGGGTDQITVSINVITRAENLWRKSRS